MNETELHRRLSTIEGLDLDLDLDLDLALHNVGGKLPRLVHYLHRMFNEHGDDALVLHQQLAAGNREQALRQAHSLKGIAGTLGLSRLQTLAAELERFLREENNNTETPSLQALEKELQRLRSNLDTLLSQE